MGSYGLLSLASFVSQAHLRLIRVAGLMVFLLSAERYPSACLQFEQLRQSSRNHLSTGFRVIASLHFSLVKAQE